jgi:transposase
VKIFVGVDWAEAHHDICVIDESGAKLGKRRVPEGIEGVRQFHELVAPFIDEPADAQVGIETDRGLFVGALVAAGYRVRAVNPFSASRYRDRHSSSGAKSDPGDAEVLADLVRTDGHNHREIAGDSDLAEAVKILARAHQSMIWARGRQTNALRSTLREYYPNALVALGDSLHAPEALEILSIAPTPALGRQLSTSKISSALRRAGRQRRIEESTEKI